MCILPSSRDLLHNIYLKTRKKKVDCCVDKMPRYLVNVEINDVLSDEATSSDSSDCTDDEFNIDIPESFICPLTLEIYRDPLMSRCGKNFERKAIVEWLDRGNDTCPLTRQPLSLSLLVPNAKLRIEVDGWKRRHGFETKTFDKSNETPPQQMRNQQFLCNIDTDMLHNILQDDHENRQEGRETTTHSEEDNNYQGRRRRRRDARSTGFSPTPQRQRRGFTTLLGEALNAVRHPSLTGN